MGWFPLAGVLIGALLVCVDWVARSALAPRVADALLVAVLVAATGAFHLDGLIDTADGLSAGPDPTARLAAMRRTVAGIPGAIAGCMMVFGTYTALTALDPEIRPSALLLAPICGRSAILLGYRVYPYGRDEPTLSRSLKEAATTRPTLAGLGVAVGVAMGLAGPNGVALLALSMVVVVGMAQLTLRRIPGLTGDTHGAICELSQLAALLAAPIILRW